MSEIKQEKCDRDALERIARMFSAFSDATRLLILQKLRDGPCSVSGLVAEVGGSQGNVSKQLRLLAETGFVTRKKQANQVIYSVSDDTVFSLCNLICNKIKRDNALASELAFKI